MTRYMAIRLIASTPREVMADMIVEWGETIDWLDDDRTAYRRALLGLVEPTSAIEHIKRLSEAIDLLNSTERPGDDPDEDRLLRAKMDAEKREDGEPS